MVTTASTPQTPGSSAIPFSLPDTRNAQIVCLEQFSAQPLLIAFICNHCPYVVHILEPFVQLAQTFASQNVATVAISANDATRYAADGPDYMQKLANNMGFDFPYCYDESQDVARAYGAVCTPDLYLYDANHTLYYHGQFDDTRPGQGQATGDELKAALTQLLDHQPPPQNTRPSVGCSIKWKHG